MDVHELRGRLGSPTLAIVDVRHPAHWEKSHAKIPGAVRREPEEVHTWAGEYPKADTIVLYCA